MTTAPHLAFGMFAGAVVASFHLSADPGFTSRAIDMAVALTACGIGSLAPDIDAPGTPASKAFPFIARPIQARWPHRTAVHSLIGAFVAVVLVFLMVDLVTRVLPVPDRFSGLVASFFLGGFIGHLCVDTLTINGVKWFWKYPRAFAYPTPRRHRIRTGDRRAERWYAVFFMSLFCAFLPVLIAGGPVRTIHKSFKNFYMARDDYLSAGGQETVLEFSGIFRHSRATVHGTGLILDVRGGGFVVFSDGQILTVGDEAAVLATSYVVEYSNDFPKVLEWPFNHNPLDSILAQVPANTLISGKLVGHQQFEATVPMYATDEFRTVAVTGNSIRLAYASGADITGLGVRLPESVREKQRELQALREEVASVGRELGAMTDSLGKARDLLARHQLRERMTELKNREKSLKEKLEKSERTAELADTNGFAFSGKLLLRKLPDWTRNQ